MVGNVVKRVASDLGIPAQTHPPSNAQHLLVLASARTFSARRGIGRSRLGLYRFNVGEPSQEPSDRPASHRPSRRLRLWSGGVAVKFHACSLPCTGCTGKGLQALARAWRIVLPRWNGMPRMMRRVGLTRPQEPSARPGGFAAIANTRRPPGSTNKEGASVSSRSQLGSAATRAQVRGTSGRRCGTWPTPELPAHRVIR